MDTGELRFLKGNIVKNKTIYILAGAMLLVTLLAVESGYCQSNYAVLVQESPAGAGKINPGMGVHSFSANKTISLNAVPSPGWQFVYWLGSVSDPTRNNTTLAVNGPKIVIAVFERVAYKFGPKPGNPSVGPEISTPQFYSPNNSYTGGGRYIPPPPPPPPPIPEPATISMLAAGVFILRNKMRKRGI